MRLLEIPTAKIEAELAALGDPQGPHSSLYAMGASAALLWLLRGTPPASQGGPTAMPVILEPHNRRRRGDKENV